MIQYQQKKQVGNTILFDVRIKDKPSIMIYVTKWEFIEVAKLYHINMDQSIINKEFDLQKLSLQGQLFLILNNIIDWRGIDNGMILQLIESEQEDELYKINELIYQKMSDQQTKEMIEKGLKLESENRFIELQKQIILYQLYSQQQEYEKSLNVLLDQIAQLKANQNTCLFYLFNCYINSSQLLSMHGRREEALLNLKQADSLLKQLFSAEELIFYKCIVQINIANVKQDLFELSEVSEILDKCLSELDSIKAALPHKIQRLVAQIHNNLSTCYQQQGEDSLDKSLEHSLISLQMNEAYFGNSQNSEIAKNLMNISTIYKDLEMIDQAITYALKAEEIFTQIDDKENLPICMGMIALIYQEEESNYTRALEYSQKCVQLLEKHGKNNTVDYAIAQYGLSNVYHSMHSNECALKSVQLALSQFQDIQEEHYQVKCFELISKIYNELHNLDDAIDHLYDAIQIREKIEADNPTEELFLSYSNIALLWEEKGDAQESKYYTDKANKLEKLLKQFED